MDLHIVFGRVEKTLIDSKEINPDNSQIISLYDNLNIGPLCDIHDPYRVEKRKDWLKDTFGDTLYVSHMFDAVDKDLEIIESIIWNSGEIDKIYIWTGYSSSEMISTARLISHLAKLHKTLLIPDYPNISVKSTHGAIIYPKVLAATASSQIKDILDHFSPVNNEDCINWQNLWERLVLEEGLLRVFESDTDILTKDIDHFDPYLLANCTFTYQKSARIIGKTLIDIDFNVDDNYLNWRLKQLAKDRKIDHRGTLVEMRDYEVRLS